MRRVLYPLVISSNEIIEKVGNVVDIIYKIPRTGWTDRGVPEHVAETVGEHTDSAIDFAEEFFGGVPCLKEMIKIHDWPKAIVGDQRSDHLCDPAKKLSPEEKYNSELSAMQTICSELGDYGKDYLNCWIEFKEGETDNAKLANQICKFSTIRKAVAYEIEGYPVVSMEFIEDYSKQITHPVIIKQLREEKFKRQGFLVNKNK